VSGPGTALFALPADGPAVDWFLMVDEESLRYLNRITTCWTLVLQAHEGSRVGAAREALLRRYSGAISRYLLAALRDPDAAEEVGQEFACCFVRGDFKQADPQKGRFRDLVKTVLFHLIVNYQRERQKRARLQPLPEGSGFGQAPEEESPSDREFLDRWREELLERAWEGLHRVQEETGQPFYTMLRFRAENPDTSSGEMAGLLSNRVGKSLTAAGVRQTLHRAREKFADLLLEEVARSLETSDPERIEQELIDLGLLACCRPALKRRDPRAPS